VTGGMGSETFGYDSYGRLSQATQTFTGRESHPLLTNYTWDTLDRMQKLTYPMRYGTSDVLRKEMTLTYDIASRLNGLTFDGSSFASNPVYNAASQIESLNVGSLKQLDIGENRRLNAAVLAAFFAFDDEVSESNLVSRFV
jgi:hypothetical protein